MSRSNKNWLIITSGAAPVYKDSSFNASVVSDAVYGESCFILDSKDNWLKIQCEDGYEGWVNSFYGDISPEKNKPSHVVVFPYENETFNPRFPFGAKVTSDLPGTIQIADILELDQVIPIAKNLLGIPYKWGGKTSLGFDCSGLVQTVLQICGLAIPRDSFQQQEFFPHRIKMEEAEPGDLHFFGKDGKVSHVGFSTGGGGIIHSQGKVNEESLNPSSEIVNQKLVDIYLSTQSIHRKFRP